MSKKTEKRENSDLILSGVGACLTVPLEKKKAPLVVIAYSTGASGKEIAFTLLEAPAKGKLYTPDDLLQAIATAEGVGHATYTDADGRAKDICFCRPGAGKITDVVERDYEKNRYVGSIAEIYAAQQKFILEDEPPTAFKVGKKISAALRPSTGSQYEQGSLAYAMVNAYNACLLARVFEREELQLETKSKRRVKIEVRAEVSAFLENEVLYVKPVFRGAEELIDHYLTEEFHYIDGENISCRSYKIVYSNHLNDYNLVRV